MSGSTKKGTLSMLSNMSLVELAEIVDEVESDAKRGWTDVQSTNEVIRVCFELFRRQAVAIEALQGTSEGDE
jgi:hypothetical protein